MDPDFILPFLESIKRVFSTMLKIDVTFKSPEVVQASRSHYDVSAIIGFSGDLVGAVILSFPNATALNCVTAFVGMEVEIGGEDFADAIGELANMISGGAKANIQGHNVSISCPSIVTGEGHRVQQPSDAVCVRVPCHIEGGEFAVDVCIRPVHKATQAQAA